MAALNIAQNPGHNAGTIFGTAPSSAAFQPTLPTPPTDWTLAINYISPVLQNPADIAIDGQGNAWVVSSANGVNSTVSLLNTAGIAASYVQNGANYSHIALDSFGDPWLTNTINSTVLELTSAGTRASSNPFTGGGISGPGALAFDATGNVWIANRRADGEQAESEWSRAVAFHRLRHGRIERAGRTGAGYDGQVVDRGWRAERGRGAGNQGTARPGIAVSDRRPGWAVCHCDRYPGGAWVANRTGSSLTRISSSGQAISGSPYFGRRVERADCDLAGWAG